MKLSVNLSEELANSRLLYRNLKRDYAMTKQRSLHHIYHLADERNWQSIQTDGLLSATKLFESANLHEWIRCHRTDNIQLPNGVVIRDQKPMPPAALARCLAHGLTAADWYAQLNRHVFFWIDLERLNRQRQACKTPQYIMIIDANCLLKNYATRAAVTPFNTGNARRVPAKRCLESFVPYDMWINSGWDSEAIALATKPRPLSHKPVELTIIDAVPNIFDFVINSRRLECDEQLLV